MSPAPSRSRFQIAFALALAVLCLVAVPPADAEPVIEPIGDTFRGHATDTAFPGKIGITVDGERHVLRALGSGTRKQLLFKVYECAPYALVSADLGSDPARAMIEGRFPKYLVLKFVRETTGDKVRDAYQKGFDKVLGPRPAKGLVEAKDRLLGYFTDGIAEGETIELVWIPGKGLYTRVGGKSKPHIQSDALAGAIMDIYLGDDPVSEDMKQGMLRFVTRD